MMLLFVGSIAFVLIQNHLSSDSGSTTSLSVAYVDETKVVSTFVGDDATTVVPVVEKVNVESNADDCLDCTTKSLSNTVKSYDRHVIICGYSSMASSHIERDNFFIEKLNAYLKEHSVTIKITACNHPNSSESYLDLIIFPERVLVSLNEESEYDIEMLAMWLLNTSIPLTLPKQPLPFKRLILVCTHTARDKRCGRIGPQIIEELQSVLKIRGIGEDEVTVRGSSHVGGHEWAGIVVVYPQCDWYGYISKRNAGELLDGIISGNKLARCWRGRGSTYEW
jgi:hypothetical protein